MINHHPPCPKDGSTYLFFNFRTFSKASSSVQTVPMDVMKSDVVVRKPMCDESVLFSTRFRFGILSITTISNK